MFPRLADGASLRSPGRARFAARRLPLVLLGMVLLAGCTPTAPRQAMSGGAESPPTADAVAGILTQLSAASRDAASWSRWIDAADPGFPAMAERFRGNLAQFRVEFIPAGSTQGLPEARVRQLGPSARAHAVRVRWAVPGEPAPAEHLAWLTLTNSADGPRLAGLTDGPREGAARPIWWDGAVTVHRGDGVAVITMNGTDPDPWLAGLTKATATLADHDLPVSLLVAEIPASAAGFERVLGVRPGSHRQVAATVWPFGSTVRIVVNPDRAPPPGPARQVLLTHEAVHAATGSVGRDIPLWLVEGYADLVALAGQPEISSAHRQHLAEDQRSHGVASELVTTAELAPDHPRVHANYQRAWLTVGVLDRGRGSAGRVHAAVVAGAPLDQALAAENWTEADLTVAVRAELVRLVGR